ncbi:MAG TPA: hypothetical protein VHP14_19095 [Anaerolineales bacterium]|nr:hypothetical protein [Anaerolineales bacterium]
MSRLLEFFLGSILITAFTVALMFFSVLQLVLKAGSTVDCAWHGSARTWIDMNADGLVDHDEPPLVDVNIHVDDVTSQLVPVRDPGWTASTDKDGDVQFNIPIPECAGTSFEIYPDIPTGYRLTTRSHLDVGAGFWQAFGKERIYYFGFAPDR